MDSLRQSSALPGFTKFLLETGVKLGMDEPVVVF